MINYVYQLVSPGVFSVKYEDMNFNNKLIVRPTYMALCHADQRYYLGQRSLDKLRAKLPMALIHECVGKVVYDSTGTYSYGQKVVMIPNVPSKNRNPVIFENYEKGSSFLSSGKDGFMREFVDIDLDRVVPYEDISEKIAAISEFVSVGVHAVTRFKNAAHSIRNSVGIWGDGSLAYVVACIIRQVMPEVKIFVVGRDGYKLSQFLFADGTYFSDNIPKDFSVDHAFECAGGEGSYYAIDDIINYINPQGTAVLMGVSENKISVNTRDILEKGLTMVGSSRSGREDFKKTVELLKNFKFQNRLSRIIYEDKAVESVSDIHRVFKTDLNTYFKTVFKWNL